MAAHADSCRVWIGLDDTDNPDSGCTTATFDDLLKEISQIENVEIIERRLVRLWPFAERRTRGNGALACVIDCPKNLSYFSKSYFLIFSINFYPN